MVDLNVIERARATPKVALLEVIQMDPAVRGILQTFDHWHSLVMCSSILFHRIMVHDTRPKKCRSLAGLHFDAQTREIGFTAFFDIRQVQEEGQNTRTAAQTVLTPATKETKVKISEKRDMNCLVQNLRRHVVMHAVELSRFVLQDLEGFRVRIRDIRDFLNLPDCGPDARMVFTTSSAPCIG